MSGKVFIQRDYSGGTRCQFQSKFPAELENRVRRGWRRARRTEPAHRAGPGRACARGAFAGALPRSGPVPRVPLGRGRQLLRRSLTGAVPVRFLPGVPGLWSVLGTAAGVQP